jgi:hypothetical protein
MDEEGGQRKEAVASREPLASFLWPMARYPLPATRLP